MDPEEIIAALKETRGELKQFAEKAEADTKQHLALSTEAKERVDELLAKQTELQDNFQALQQSVDKMEFRGTGAHANMTAGQIVAADASIEAFQPGVGSSAGVEIPRAALGANDIAAPQPDYQPGLVFPAQQQFRVRDLLTPGSTNLPAIIYDQETGFDNNADMVAKGGEKPESFIKIETQTAPVRKIAHYIRVDAEDVADRPTLQSHIDGRLRFGLALKEEGQLLYGNGNGQNLTGIVPQATPFAAAFSPANTTPIDVLRLAMLQAQIAEYPATGIVLNYVDWAVLETTKDENGRYIIGDPARGTQPLLWGLPVVSTPSMAAGKFLVGAFRMGAQIFDRLNANVQVSTEDRDNFIKNKVTILIEERLALAVYRPEAFVYGNVSGGDSTGS